MDRLSFAKASLVIASALYNEREQILTLRAISVCACPLQSGCHPCYHGHSTNTQTKGTLTKLWFEKSIGEFTLIVHGLSALRPHRNWCLNSSILPILFLGSSSVWRSGLTRAVASEDSQSNSHTFSSHLSRPNQNPRSRPPLHHYLLSP